MRPRRIKWDPSHSGASRIDDGLLVAWSCRSRFNHADAVYHESNVTGG
jgi:hypothetical protein